MAAVRISIIIASLNAEATIGRCLGSIAGQDYPDIEVIVADGGSADRTIEIVSSRKPSMGERLLWFSEPDEGIADAWNKAIARISGDWVLFLGADDELVDSHVIGRASSILSSAYPAYRVVYGKVWLVDARGTIVQEQDPPWRADLFRRCLMAIPHQATFHHRSLFRDHGRFDGSFTIVSDRDFLLRELKRSEPMHLADFPVSRVRIGGISTSRRHLVRLSQEEIRLYRRHVGGVRPSMIWGLAKTVAIVALHRAGGDSLALRISNFYRRYIARRPPLKY